MLESEYRELMGHIHEAGRTVMDLFGRQLDLTVKSGSDDFQTEADRSAERIVARGIEQLFPDCNILGEEHGATDKGSDRTFVIDPLDGTHNFVHGIPLFTINVALMHDRQTEFGIVHHPVTGSDYYASRGKGAFLDGAPIRVSTTSELAEVRASYYCNYTTPKLRAARFKSALLQLGCQRAFDIWAPGFCFSALAAGRLDALINDGTEIYDYAAGKLIAAEAGARSTDFLGADDTDTSDVFLMTNGTGIHETLVEELTTPLANL